MPEHYDVVIAGGGPAGLVAARTAAKEGGKVLLLELQAQIGGQTKSGAWVPSELIDDSFERAIVDSVESVVLNSPHETLRVEGDFGVIIDRSIFDKTLATKTAKENVEIWVGSPVKEILKDKNGVCGVRAEAGDWSESVNCEVVIDATGAQGKWSSLHLRQVLEKDWNEENLSQSNEYLMANAESESEVEIYFNSLLAPQGHAWNFPFGQDLVMTGIRGVRIHPDAALDEFIGRENPTILRDSSPIAAFRGQLPLEKIEDNYSDGIMAIGSAAGQVYPLSGHKTKYALEAGE
ncbi:MAG: NAD(P)/FAD-dependent oxidoreductase, partial [Hadesarchaea archaeon]|nr:NAD(P)/FAD-dependent oxidoreductase [Hadesarchaea archaeon]